MAGTRFSLSRRTLTNLSRMLLLVVPGAIVATSVSVAACAVDRCISGGVRCSDAMQAMVCLLLAIGLSVAIWHLRERTRKLIVNYHGPSAAKPKEVLIIPLSKPSFVLDMVEGQRPVTITDKEKRVTLDRNDLRTDTEELGRVHCNWEQIMRAIAPHVTTLRRIVFIGSGGPKGSHTSLASALAFFGPYLPDPNIIVLHPEPVDFEDFDALDRAFSTVIDLAVADRYREGSICIDITGGQKPTSAAGCISSLNKGVVVQYVQTEAPKEAKLYDINFKSPAEVQAGG